jgi:hypothetical protein
MLPLQERVCGAPVITQLMGGSPDDYAARYEATSPATLLPVGVPLVTHAGSIFGEQAERFHALAEQAGERIKTVVRAGAGHFVFIDPESAEWPGVLDSVLRLPGMQNR